jgi:hypothetical protein
MALVKTKKQLRDKANRERYLREAPGAFRARQLERVRKCRERKRLAACAAARPLPEIPPTTLTSADIHNPSANMDTGQELSDPIEVPEPVETDTPRKC